MSDKMREQFENHCRVKFGWDESRFEMHAGQYLNGKTFHDYETWKASRAAMVIELPPTCCRTLIFEQENTLEVGMEHGEYYDPDDVKEALVSAGIRYE